MALERCFERHGCHQNPGPHPTVSSVQPARLIKRRPVGVQRLCRAPDAVLAQDALRALQILSSALASARLVALDLSGNALGEKGVRACASVLTAQVGPACGG